jgi:DNA end-binding protein Ku
MTALRSLWNGSLRYHELQVPVALAATRGSSDVALRTLHRPCAHPLVQQLECPIHGFVPQEELVSGWEVAPGEYVLIEPEELEQAAGAADRTIEVLRRPDGSHCVFPLEQLDPALVQASYWLMPASGMYARRGYRLVADVLAKGALLVRLNYRSEKRAVVHARPGGLLLLQTLSAAGERHSPAPILDELADADTFPSGAERRMLRQLLRNDLAPLEESLIVNPRRQQLRALVEAKLAAGGGATVTSEPVTVAETLHGRRTSEVAPADLGQALKRSLAQINATKPKPPSRRKKATVT